MMLSIENLAAHYDNKDVLKALNFEIQEGEIIGLLGSSGCGKTTLLKILAGLQASSSGQVILDGEILNDQNTHVPAEKRNIGLIFQDYALFPHLTVHENIAFGLVDWSLEDKNKRVQQMLDLIRLPDCAARYPDQLSGGQQQRVAIARSLACKPKLMLLDEPFSNIDAQARSALIQEVRGLLKSQNVTAILVTHSRDEAFAFSDNMAVMHNGQIEQYGAPESLYHRPNSPLVADFLGQGSYINAIKISDNKFESDLGIVTAKSSAMLQVGAESRLFFRPQQIKVFHINQQCPVHNYPLATVISKLFMGGFELYQLKVKESLFWAVSCEIFEPDTQVCFSVSEKGIAFQS